MIDSTEFIDNLHSFHKGENFFSYRIFGAHPLNDGVRFTVWAPGAHSVSVVGNFNHWNGAKHVLHKCTANGIWTTVIPGLKVGEMYKYEIQSKCGRTFLKSDPFAFYSEQRPNTASIVTTLTNYQWQDEHWQTKKLHSTIYEEPLLIYEVHLGSWKRKESGEFYSYRELADELVQYVKELGYTHIEILPIAEHPFDGSWGYQGTGFFSVTSRYGSPNDFKYFVDQFHQHGIGVILDWVPGHFCKDDHGLRMFDGSPTYEYEDSRIAEKKQWGTLMFDVGKREVVSYLISNAIFWMDIYHIDGLRVDAVSSMLYYNHERNMAEDTIVNKFGGNENLEAISFIKALNEAVFRYYPNALMIAEESTAWPNVTKPTYIGGLGFNFKWNMGWMNDMLKYMELDPIHRKFHHQLITFSFLYAFSENFILPLSHDEVVHGKKSLLNKMPGDYWRKFANLRLFFGYMIAHPGKKLLFMGGEFGQFDEWKDGGELDWMLLDFEMHQKMQFYVKELQQFYRKEESLFQLDHHHEGFEWIDPNNFEQSIISFIRKGKDLFKQLIIVINFTPVVYEDYKVGVPFFGEYKEVFNSDLQNYGGSNIINSNIVKAKKENWHNQPYSISIKIPPLSFIAIKPI